MSVNFELHLRFLCLAMISAFKIADIFVFWIHNINEHRITIEVYVN